MKHKPHKLNDRPAAASRPGEPVPVEARTNPAEASREASLNPQTSPKPAPTEEMIRNRAHALWEAAGRPEGDGLQFWLEAERELLIPR